SARRELVGRFLAGYLKVIADRDADRPRDRFFVHAEPGLVAMLLYAAVRILPPTFTADLTFSTFEPAHRGIRDFKLATVIGTYLGGAAKGLDIDLVSARGYGIDTLHPARSSRELAGGLELPAGIAELIDLAARGEWELLADVHKLIRSETDPLGRVTQTVPLARALQRLSGGTVTDDDLITLKSDRRGSAVLTNPALRAAFKDWLAEPTRLSEFRRQAAELLLHGDVAGWDARWAVVRDAADPEQLKLQADKARKSLDSQIPSLPPAARKRLRDACAEGGAWPDHHLLAPVSPDELEHLLAADVPAECQGYTSFAVMGPDEKNWLVEATRPYRPVMRELVRRHLMAAPAAVLAGYILHAKPFIASDPVFLLDLFRPFRPACIDFLSRLIDAGAASIEATDWFTLLDELNVYSSPEWSGFLLRNDHLAKLLAGFKADPIAIQFWDWGVAQLSPALFEGDAAERAVYDQLRRAAVVLTAAGIPLKSVMSAGGPARLNGADTILAVAANPASAESLADGELVRSFEAFGIDPLEGLRKLYLRGGFARLDLKNDAKPLSPFAAAFLACYPISHEYFSVRTAVAQWLAISESCPAQTRGEFQLFLIRNYVPAHWYQETLEETRRSALLPEVEARIREMILAEARPTTRYVPPTTPTKKDEDAPFESAATKRARGSGQERKSFRGRRDSGGLPIMVIVLGLLAIAGIAVAIVLMMNR
ncbi:MAG TPA: hypothetical protein VLM40_22500, partial [Gemmata sp.]|nr:hypothetical protein [Gemmata sp.]